MYLFLYVYYNREERKARERANVYSRMMCMYSTVMLSFQLASSHYSETQPVWDFSCQGWHSQNKSNDDSLHQLVSPSVTTPASLLSLSLLSLFLIDFSVEDVPWVAVSPPSLWPLDELHGVWRCMGWCRSLTMDKLVELRFSLARGSFRSSVVFSLPRASLYSQTIPPSLSSKRITVASPHSLLLTYHSITTPDDSTERWSSTDGNILAMLLLRPIIV